MDKETEKIKHPTKFKPKSTIDLAGSGAEHATPEEMKRLLDKLREEAH